MSESANAAPTTGLRQVVLVTGISGSGKSVALHALEDGGAPKPRRNSRQA